MIFTSRISSLVAIIFFITLVIEVIEGDDPKNDKGKNQEPEQDAALRKEWEEEMPLLRLSQANFESKLAEHPRLFLMFYAPWCEFSRQARPEFIAASKLVASNEKEGGDSPGVTFAVVDGYEEEQLAGHFEVAAFPTFLLFLPNDTIIQYVSEDRTAAAMSEWVTRMAFHPSRLLKSSEELKNFLAENDVAVVEFFFQSKTLEEKDLQTDINFQQFNLLAQKTAPGAAFGHVLSEEVAADFDLKSEARESTDPFVFLFRPFDEPLVKFDGNVSDLDALIEFVGTQRIPLITELTEENAGDIFNDGRSLVLLVRDEAAKEDSKEAGAVLAFREAANHIGRSAIFIICGLSRSIDRRVLDHLGTGDDESLSPSIWHVDPHEQVLMKHRMPQDVEITAKSISQFLGSVMDGTLLPHIRSQPVPLKQPGPVYEVVGSTFEDVILHTDKDILLMFYAPWCGHCQRLEPIFREVAQKITDEENIFLAKIDASANDVPLPIDGYPTIMLFPSEDKLKPILYDGPREVNALLDFLAVSTVASEGETGARDEL